MVVSDSSLFPPGMMIRVRVTNMNGVDIILDVGKSWKCDTVKLSLKQLLDSGLGSDPVKDSVHYKLVLVRTSSALIDDQTLVQQGVKDNDELLLLRKRLHVPLVPRDDKQDDRKSVDITNIRKATAHLPKKNIDTPDVEASSNLDFQSELRRILISLIEASQHILCLNPEAAKIFKKAEEMLNEAPSRKTALSEASVKQLTDMGFPENRARKALLLNQHSVMTAMDWLLTNESDPDIDQPLPGQDPETPEPELKQETQGAEGGQIEGAEEEGATGATDQPKFKNILETIRAFQWKEFRPDPRSLQSLLEMGFLEKEAIQALRQSRNNQDAACEWLLSERKEKTEHTDEGLDPNSPVYKAILAHPAVQLGLNSPRCLLAFLQMLENPLSANHWLNDPETGALLMHISRIYHSEKLSPVFADTEDTTDIS